MEQPPNILAAPENYESVSETTSESAKTIATDVALLVPSPNWFFPRVFAVTPDGWLLYGAMTRGIAILRPSEHGDNIYRAFLACQAHGDRVSCVALSEDWLKNRRLLTGSKDGFVKQWSIREKDGDITLHPTNAHDVHKTCLDQEEVVEVAYCGEDSALSLGHKGTLVKWDLRANITRVYKKLFKSFKVTCMSCCPHDPLTIAVGTKQGVLFVANLATKANILYKIRGHNDEITDLSWCPQAEVTIDTAFKKVKKFSANQRMEKIRQGEPETSELEQKMAAASLNTLDSVAQAGELDQTNEESIVEEDDTFDIYADHESEEFGHKKFQPKTIYVPVDKPEENVDFLAECLKLKKDIISSKNKQEKSIYSLVQSLENAVISMNKEKKELVEDEGNAGIQDKGNAEDEDKGNSKVEDKEIAEVQDKGNSEVEDKGNSEVEDKGNSEMSSSTEGSKTDETKLAQAEELAQETIHHLLISCDKTGKICLWNNGKHLAGFPMQMAWSKHMKASAGYGSLHWYRPNTLFMSDGKNNVLECDPLKMFSENKAKWKVLHSLHKRGIYCVTSAAPKIQSPNTEIVDCPIWSVGQDRNLVSYSLEIGKEVVTVNTFGGHVYHITPSQYDAKKVSVSGGDGAVRVCELGDDVTQPCSSVTTYWQNVQGKVTISALHPTNENMLAFGTAEGRVGLINLSSSNADKPARILFTIQRSVYSLSWGEHNTLYVCSQGSLYVFDTKKDHAPKEVKVEFEGKLWHPTEALWTERALVVGSKDGDIAVLTPQSPYTLIATAFTFQKMVHCIVWHPQGVTLSDENTPYKNWIAACPSENYFAVFNLCEEDGKFKLAEVATARGHKRQVLRLAWSPHRNGQILSTSQDATVRVWDISASGGAMCLSVFDRHMFVSLAAMWWPQPAYPDHVLSGGGDQALRLWNFTEFPPSRHSIKAMKNIHFTMAQPETEDKENEPVKSKKPPKEKRNEDNLERKKETVNAEVEEESGDEELHMANVKCSRNIRFSRNPLLPIMYGQTKRRLVAGCRRLVRKVAEANGSEEQACYDGEEWKGTDFVKLFGTMDEFNEALDMEQANHLEQDHLYQWIVVSMMRGQIDKVFQMATSRGILGPFLLSVAPMVSYKFWKDQVRAYILQLDRQATEESALNHRPLSAGGIYCRVMLLLSQHDVMGAIEALVEYSQYREAYILARVRHMDDVARDLLAKWANYYHVCGNRAGTALCYLAMGRLVDASTVLSKMPEEDGALDLAAEVAKLTGQDTLADTLMKKKDKLEKSEDILKPLADRMALHLKMKEMELSDKTGTENGGQVENGIGVQ